MIWKKCILYERKKVSEDILGNPVVEWVESKETIARDTPWTSAVVSLENRDVTKNEQCFSIPIPFKNFPTCQRAEIDGVMQDVVEIIDLSPRYTVLRVRVYKK